MISQTAPQQQPARRVEALVLPVSSARRRGVLKAAVLLVGLGLAFLTSAETARATFTYSDGGSHQASVDFSVDGSGNLVITLRNTFQAPNNFQFVPTDILTGLFFDVQGNPALSAVTNSVQLSAGSTLVHSSFGSGTLSDHWYYASGNLGSGVSQRYGIGATGLVGGFGPNSSFGTNGSIPNQPQVAAYALIPLGQLDYSHAQFASTPFIQNSATFKLSGFGNLPLSDITNVRFQWGTSTSEFSGVGTQVLASPVPGSLTLALCGLSPLGVTWLRRRFARAA